MNSLYCKQRLFPAFLILGVLVGYAQDQAASPRALLEQARAAQAAGDWGSAKATLAQAAKLFPNEVQVAHAQARLLDAAGDPERRKAYARLVALEREKGQDDPAAQRRLALLALAEGDRQAAAATGALKLPPVPERGTAAGTLHIPGPLASFMRMAAISSQTPNNELLTALSRNVFTLGYHFSQRLNKTTPTEYLNLLTRYVEEARELEKMAGPDGQLTVASCEASQPLLKVLGFKLRKSCGPGAVVETDDPARAFLTIDSGFPLAELEASFRNSRPFAINVRGPDVPVLFSVDAWFEKDRDPLDQLLEGREIPRLYHAISQLDSRTAEVLRQSPGLTALRDVAPVIDFYGSSFSVENGRPVLPGGPERLAQWAQMIGADPAKPGEFLSAFFEKDNGWVAAYADSFHQMDARQQAYYFSGNRLERFYKALRGQGTTPGSARPVFRPNAELLLLPARMRLGADGHPLIPAGVATWKTLFQQQTPKGAKGASRTVYRFNDADDVLEALYARVRLFEENGLLNIFVTLNEVDRRRSAMGHPLEPSTVIALANDYSRFSHHYSLFADRPEITDASILKFLKVCDNLVKIKNPMVKGDALGAFQAVVGLWEIFARQSQIPDNALGSSFDALLGRFGPLDKPAAVFDAGRAGLETVVAATGTILGPPRTGSGIHETIIGLLAGPHPPESAGENAAARQGRDYVLGQIRSALDSQRLIRLDTLFGLADAVQHSGPPNPEVLRMAGQLREFRLPNTYVSAVERNAAFPGYWTERHLDQMRDVDLGQLVEKRQRGVLTPFLRDTLVGLNYAYYAPPGAQVLFHNPLFVRSHDFMGRNGSGTGNEIWGPGRISGTGWPLSGGGRLVGALSGLPYGLAEAEQDFLIPQNTQALIWSDLAPQMLISAVIPRWWEATPRQLRWVALNQRFAEDLVAEAVADPEVLRPRLLALLHGKIAPRRFERFEQAVAEARLDDAQRLLTPAEMYRLSREWVQGPAFDSPAFKELTQLAGAAPQELADQRISRLFGVPRPKLARSWLPELLGLAPFPALQGYSSRLLAESWESNNLYWARLADEMNLPPAALPWLVPQLTRRLIEHIFANHHEDWPALLRALHQTAEEYRRQAATSTAASE